MDSERDRLRERIKGAWRDRRKRYRDPGAAKEWFSKNWARIAALFEVDRVRDFVFEPLGRAWSDSAPSTDDRVLGIITQVAVANAAVAGLPGKLGVGVYVCMALEAYMAVAIARRVGVQIERPGDIWKYFSLLAGVGFTILWGFRHLLGLAFSLFNLVGALPATVLAEFTVTAFVGAAFWTAFDEVADERPFGLPLRAMGRLGRRLRRLLGYQRRALAGALSPAKLKQVGERLYYWLTGEIIEDEARVRGDVFCASAMAWLLMGRYDELNGPLSGVFLQAIRDRFSALGDASPKEIADFMRIQYEEDQLAGVVNLVKGRLFERLVEIHENADGDNWTAVLHEDASYPGSDITFVNETGETIEVSLKATRRADYVEAALMRYPEIPILTTDEIASEFEDLDLVAASGFTNRHITEVTEANFERLLGEVCDPDAVAAVGAGTGAAVAALLWPFVVARIRGRISTEQLLQACAKILPESGRRLGLRLAFAAALGPIFAWYLLARMTMSLTPEAPQEEPTERSRRLSYTTGA